MTINNNTKGALVLILSGFVFSIINLITQSPAFLELNISVSIVTFYQYSIAFFFLLPYLLKHGLFSSLKTKNIKWHIARVIFAVLGVHTFVAAILHGVPINQVIGLITTSTIFVVIGSAVFLKEKIGIERWIATFGGCLGAFIILQPWSDKFTWYTILPLIASILWALYSIIVKKISSSESPISITAYLFLLTTPFNLIKAIPDFPKLAIESNALIFLIILGLLTAIAQYCISKSYNLADASYIQPFDHIKIIFNIVGGWIFLHQIPEKTFWAGLVMVIISVSFITFYEQKLSTKSKLKSTITKFSGK